VTATDEISSDASVGEFRPGKVGCAKPDSVAYRSPKPMDGSRREARLRYLVDEFVPRSLTMTQRGRIRLVVGARR
jgi:hypothetical protein